MNLETVLTIVQIVLSLILIVLVTIQTKGVGFGRSSFISGSSFTRRGIEKAVFKFTFIVVAIFFAVSIFKIVA